MPLDGNEESNIEAAIDLLNQAEERLRRVKLCTTPITIHWIDVARIHCRASLNDVRREKQ